MPRTQAFHSWRVAVTLLAMLVAGSLLVTGCSNENPVEPMAQTGTTVDGGKLGDGPGEVQEYVDGYGSETAFGYGCEMADCFDEYGFQRWGWTNWLMEEGTYYFDLYAGAGQCDLEKGTLVGWVEVVYEGDMVTVTYHTCGSYLLEEVHVYVGENPVATMRNGRSTVAPGQYTEGRELDGVDEYTIEIPYMGDGVYVIAHAVVSGDYSMGDCGEPGCEPMPEPCVPGVYLADGGPAADRVTLNQVVFSEGVADLVELYDFTTDERFDYVNHIGVTPDGDWIWVVAEDSGWVGRYSVEMDTFEVMGEIAGFPTGLVLVTVGPEGEYLYVGSQDTDEIYRVELATLNLTLLGDSGIDLLGADMDFRLDDVLYLITNSPADAGLYTIDLTTGMATAVGGFPGAPEFVTGIAIMPGSNTVIVSDPELNQIVEVFEGMDRVWDLYKDGMPFNHVWGDMASSLCPPDVMPMD